MEQAAQGAEKAPLGCTGNCKSPTWAAAGDAYPMAMGLNVACEVSQASKPLAAQWLAVEGDVSVVIAA